MARPLKPLVRGGGYYPSNKWTPLVYNGGYTTMNGGEEPEPPTPVYWKTITGVSPLALASALQEHICSLTQFGKCTQEAGASPSTPKAIYCNNGALRVSPNLANMVSDNIVVGQYINNSGIETVDTANFFYAPYIPVTPGGTYTMATSSSIWYFSVMQYDSSKNFLRRSIWGATNTPVGTEKTFGVGADCAYIRFGSNMRKATISLADVLAVDWMLTQTATAQDFRPYGEIYTDGTPEVLTAGGQNLVDLTAVTDGYYYNASGVYATADATRLTDYIPVRAGQKYTVYAQAVQSGSSVNVRCNLFDTGKVWKSQSVLVVAAGNSAVSTITPAENGFLRVSANYTGTREKVDWSTFQIVRGEYTLSTMPPYEPYITPQTVNDIPMLLGLGDTVRDEWDAISGLLTGKVGVKVFDGTEDWGASSSANIYILASAIGVGLTAICTHFQKVANSTSAVNMSDGTFKGHASNAILYFKDVSAGNVDGFKARLAAQYAAGTPVIMPYALATETTEQTTPHSLHSYNGTTIVDASTNVDPVTLSAEYESSEE